MKHFTDFVDLNGALAEAVIAQVGGSYSSSNVSESRYVTKGDVKIRFSGHSDYHGSDHTFRTDRVAQVYYSWTEIVFDEDDEEIDVIYHTDLENDIPLEVREENDFEFDHIEVSVEDFDRIVAEAVEML